MLIEKPGDLETLVQASLESVALSHGLVWWYLAFHASLLIYNIIHCDNTRSRSWHNPYEYNAKETSATYSALSLVIAGLSELRNKS